MSSDQPFDHGLYDAVMARRSGDHTDTSSDYWDGYEECARKAAVIAAERVARRDEELLDIFNAAWNETVSRQRVEGFRIVGDDPGLCAIRAVRAAIAPQPVIPDGWHLKGIELLPGVYRQYRVTITREQDNFDIVTVSGYEGKHDDALTAACEAAQGVEP